MLYMVVMTHGSEICPMGNPEAAKKMRYAMEHMNEAMKKLNIKLNGSWVDAPAHIIYMQVDANSAHDISRMGMELHLMEWNTITINPVLTMAEVAKMVP
jgi:hypothetical protein